MIMNEKELQEAILFILVKNEISCFNASTKARITIYEELFTVLGKSMEQKEENQKTLLRFLKIVDELGPIKGSEAIYFKIKDDEYWSQMFQYFFKVGMLNSKIIKTFLSINKEMKERDMLILKEVNYILDNLKIEEEREAKTKTNKF